VATVKYIWARFLWLTVYVIKLPDVIPKPYVCRCASYHRKSFSDRRKAPVKSISEVESSYVFH